MGEKQRGGKLSITLIFHANNCLSCKRDVIQLWMHREDPRSHMPFWEAALQEPGPCSEQGQLPQPGQQGAPVKSAAFSPASAPLTGSLLIALAEILTLDFSSIAWNCCPPQTPAVQLVLHPEHWLGPRLGSPVTALPPLQLRVRNIIFTHFGPLNCHRCCRSHSEVEYILAF